MHHLIKIYGTLEGLRKKISELLLVKELQKVNKKLKSFEKTLRGIYEDPK